MTDYVEVLKDIRLQKGLTQKQLGELSGVSEAAICAWEKGKAAPTIYNFEAVLNAVGLTLEITVKER